MPVTLPDDFPILLAHGGRPDRIRAAIDVFRSSLHAGEIRTADLDAAKSALGRAVETAWRETVGAPFFHAGRWEGQSEAARKLNDAGSPSSLHDVIALSKRLAKSDCDDPAVRAMRALAAEVLPLSEASVALKGLIVKGRAPRGEPARPPNPDQERGTCSCCFRSIAVVPTGKMAHHGYERPGDGYQTSSCSGVRFKPLEVSTEGLEWLIWSVSEKLGALRERFERRDELTRLSFTVREKGRVVPKTVEKGEPDWDRRFREWERATHFAIGGHEGYLVEIEKRLAEWRLGTPGSEPEAPKADPDEEIDFGA